MARSFNGASTENIKTGAIATAATTNVSMACWLYITGVQTPQNRSAFHNGDSNSNGYGFGPSAVGNPQWALLIGGIQWDIFATTLADSAWSHLTLTRDTTTWRGYVNGVQDANTFTTNPNAPTSFLEINSSANTLAAGSRAADAAIWTVQLTQLEITALAQGIRPGAIRPASLKGWWPLGGFASPEPDLSGNNNNGTLTGTAPAANPPFTAFTPRWHRFPPAISAAPAFTLMPQIVT